MPAAVSAVDCGSVISDHTRPAHAPPNRPPQHNVVTSLPFSQELVHAAIGEAEGARELLEKVTAEGAGGVRQRPPLLG